MASGPQSFTDGLQSLAADAMRLAAMPDADPVFCMKIAQAVVAKARMPMQHSPQQGAQPPGGGAGPPGAPGPGIGPTGMPGGPPGGSPANGQMPTQGAPTMGAGPSAGLSPMNGGSPQSDEIRRMIAGGSS